MLKCAIAVAVQSTIGIASNNLVNLSMQVNMYVHPFKGRRGSYDRTSSKSGEWVSGMLMKLCLMTLEASTCPSADVSFDARSNVAACCDETVGSMNARMRLG